jgi:hypothetical protein
VACEPGQTVRFGNLPAGEYVLRYSGWRSEPIQLAEGQCVSVENVESQVSHEASLWGRVLDADGEPLAGRRVALLVGDEVHAEQLTTAGGRYGFAGLSRGVYTLQVEEAGIFQKDIAIEEGEPKMLDLQAPVGVRPKWLEHYLLLPGPSSPGLWITLLLLQDFIRRWGPAVGFEPREASMARRVTIAADESAVGSDVEQMLLDAGCLVQRLPGESYHLAEALAQLSAQTSPTAGDTRRKDDGADH